MEELGVLLAVVGLAYLVGSVPVAVVVGRRRGVDPREAGDGNPGYWNLKELVGRRAAVPVFLGDVAKGAIGAGLGTVAGHAVALEAQGVLRATWVGAAAAMVGHAWPVFAAFAGGRSILTFAGGMAVLSPRAVGLTVVALLAVWAVTRRFVWGARVAVFGVPLVVLLVDGIWRTAATGALQCLIGLRFLQAACRDRT